MKTALCFLAGLLFVSELRSEGLAINEARTKYEGPHYLIKVNDEQKEELMVCGTLTLTSEQWKAVRSKYPSIPKRISRMFPSTYNDCACDLVEREWGIWFPDGSAAIVSDAQDTPFRELSAESKRKADPNLQFRMDARGQFYASDRLVPYAEVKDQVSNKVFSEEGGNQMLLILEIPPGMGRKDAALASRIDELETLSKAVGRGFHILWE